MIKTLHLRIKDEHAKVLDAMAREVNLVWNYCNELAYTHLRQTGRFFSGYDLQRFTAGASASKLGKTSMAKSVYDAGWSARALKG